MFSIRMMKKTKWVKIGLFAPVILCMLTTVLFAQNGLVGKVVAIQGYGDKSIFVGSTTENLKKITDAIINGDKEGATAMLFYGSATVINVGTEVRIISNDSWRGMVEVRLIGDYSGETWWAYTQAVLGS